MIVIIIANMYCVHTMCQVLFNELNPCNFVLLFLFLRGGNKLRVFESLARVTEIERGLD